MVGVGRALVEPVEVDDAARFSVVALDMNAAEVEASPAAIVADIVTAGREATVVGVGRALVEPVEVDDAARFSVVALDMNAAEVEASPAARVADIVTAGREATALDRQVAP